ncbi:MAG: hypothetical protein ACRDPD_23105 [Streptosporangiaceae bacterium]
MIANEDRLRAATRAAADTVPPGTAPPLRLPDEPGRQRSRARRDRRRPGWLRAMTPLAAAAAVAGVVIASLVLTSGVHTPQGSGTGPASGTNALRGVPPYYLALADQVEPTPYAEIRSTATGAVLARVRPPRPYGTFDFVTGAADDRTFVLAAQRWRNIASGTRGLPAEHRDGATPVVFFLLRFDPGTRTARLTRLSHPAGLPSEDLEGIGLSPDGTRLALSLFSGITTPGGSRSRAPHGPGIQVVTLATGAVRQWAWPGAGWVGNFKPEGEPLSWTADGRLVAFQEWNGNDAQIRLLDTTARGADLRSSRLVVKFGDGYGTTILGGFNSLITPDGGTVVAATERQEQHPFRTQLQVSEFSARTGRVTHALARWRLGSRGTSSQDVLWTSSSGHTLIVITPPGTGPDPGTLSRPVDPVAGVLTTDGQFTALPGLVASSGVAW